MQAVVLEATDVHMYDFKMFEYNLLEKKKSPFKKKETFEKNQQFTNY